VHKYRQQYFSTEKYHSLVDFREKRIKIMKKKKFILSPISLWQQDMKDDLDHYTNTYHVYSEDLKNCQEFLDLPEVINWKQHLQIQSK